MAGPDVATGRPPATSVEAAPPGVGPPAADEVPTEPTTPSRWRSAWWALVPGLVPVLVFLEALLGRHMLAPGDGFAFYVPLRAVVARAWRSGAMPAWDPWSFSGSPLLALHQAGAFSPLNLAVLPLPVQAAHNAVVVASFALAGTGAYLFARRLGADGAGGATAGVTFALSGFLFGHIVHTAMVATIVWLPWVLWGFELVRERLTPSRMAAAATTVALTALAGHGQMLALVLAVLALYAVALAVVDRASRRHLLVAAAMVAVGAGLAAVQLVPTAAVVGQSLRRSMPFETAMSYSFTPGSLLTLVFPFVDGNQRPSGPFTAPYQGVWSLTELAAYVGAAALVLAGAGLGRSVGRRDPRRVALVVVAVGCLLLALGDSTPFGRLVHAVPVYGQLRAWARAAVGVDLVVATLAGLGVTAVRRLDPVARRAAARRAMAVAGGVVALAGATAAVPGFAPNRVTGAPGVWALALPTTAAVAAATLVVVLASPGGPRPGRRSVAVVAITAVVALDMVGFGWFFRWRDHSPDKVELAAMLSPDRPPRWGPVPDAPGGIDRMVHIGDPLEQAPTYQRILEAKRIRSVNGLDPLAPSRYAEAVGDMNWLGGIEAPDRVWAPGSHVLDLLRVSLVVTHAPTAPPPPGHLGPGRPVGDGLVRFERRPGLPDAFLVGAARRVDGRGALRALWGLAPLDPSATALVEGPCGPCPDDERPGPAGTVTTRRWGDQSTRFDVRADRAAVLVVSQSWFPGWSATVDGRPAPVVRVDGLVQGVPVPAGSHRVELRYRPPGLPAGAAVSGASVAGLAAWALARRQRQLSNQRRASRVERSASTAAYTG